MRKHFPILASICLAILAVFCVLIAARAQNPPPSAAKTAAQEFKNIQVLKDVPSDQIIPAMQFISASLGVECDYCHVEHAFDKDDKKPKKTARSMIEMMLTINQENFEGHREVTCYSCHRGAAKPISVPVISAEEKMPEMATDKAADSSSLPKPETLLNKYLAAVGGADALKKITSRVQKGTITAFGNQKMPIDIYSKAPDMRVSTVHRKDMDSVTAYDGKMGWMSVPGRVRPMNAQESEGARIDADLSLPAHLSTMFSKLDIEEGEKLGGHSTWLVNGSREGKPPVKLYFDQQSGFLLRLIRYTDSPLGLNPLQIDFADYRDSGGVKIPFRWTQARPGNRFTIQIESSEQNVPIDDSKFAPPAPSPAPAH
ncbi:MAG TPA: c-type cytochrome [Candidatus Sulfotelmatobacter sp.]|jgi:photosynthetic reaction center cytochrome c subunit|nr:c-type cytochrome [Candidatus Sulfotelmatobacter sp.]